MILSVQFVSVPFCPYHFVPTICAKPFCPYIILSIPFCPKTASRSCAVLQNCTYRESNGVADIRASSFSCFWQRVAAASSSRDQFHQRLRCCCCCCCCSCDGH